MSNVPSAPCSSNIGKHLQTRMVSGLLVLIPLAITLFVLNVFLNSLTAFARPLLKPLLGVLPDSVLTLIALILTVLLIYLTGLVTTHIVGRRLILFGERLLLRLPVVKTVYAASKQVVETFSSHQTSSFQAVVLVEFPRREALVIGFVTGTLLAPDNRLLYRVFIPTTPNPTSGFLLLLPAKDVQFTDISIEDGIKMAVSGGMLAPEKYALTGASPLP
ncbi:MAG: DUF502 domain-containing protein [Kiritimatiellia bacterium]|jgi:uncharacterized membrane protein|nr:DUF502 domain-containing protein [Kiritimatiellia bacterium]